MPWHCVPKPVPVTADAHYVSKLTRFATTLVSLPTSPVVPTKKISFARTRFFYPSRRIGMSSMQSIVCNNACVHVIYIRLDSIPSCNGFHTMLCIDSIHASRRDMAHEFKSIRKLTNLSFSSLQAFFCFYP